MKDRRENIRHFSTNNHDPLPFEACSTRFRKCREDRPYIGMQLYFFLCQCPQENADNGPFAHAYWLEGYLV